jgi:hypothetical protein
MMAAAVTHRQGCRSGIASMARGSAADDGAAIS